MASNKDCFGPVQAHHLLKPWTGSRGMGMKSNDKNVIPLCMRHHMMLHKRGDEIAFFQEMIGCEGHGKATAEAIWRISPFGENDDE